MPRACASVWLTIGAHPGGRAKVTLADNTAAGRSQSRWLATFGPPPGQPGERALNRLGPSSGS